MKPCEPGSDGTEASVVQDDAGFSVIVPVFNEATSLPRFLEHACDGLPSEHVELIFACNGCTDGSEQILRSVDDPRVRVLVLERPCKAEAIRAAETVAQRFPRFYVDADVLIDGASLVALARPLREEQFELVSPRMAYEESGMSFAARCIHRVWHDLPHVVAEGYHGVLGVSRNGRDRWDEFPILLADDAFIQSQIPASRRRIVPEITVTTRPARTFWSFVCVRERWLRGSIELRRAEVDLPRARGQVGSLAKMALSRQALGVAVYLAARVLAFAKSRVPRRSAGKWYQDKTSRG